jgi:AcrR family transcriptional regulator
MLTLDLKEQKKTDIADAARQLFTEFGYKSVSMEQIANKANVAKGTVYLYFKDKEDLFYCLVKQFIAQIKDYMENCKAKKLMVFDEMHEIVYNLLMYKKNQKFLFRVAQEAKELRTPTSLQVIRMIDDEISGYLVSRLNQAIDDKVIKPCNTSVLSFLVIKIYTALAFEWEENHEPLNEVQIANSVRMFLKDGLIIKEEKS